MYKSALKMAVSFCNKQIDTLIDTLFKKTDLIFLRKIINDRELSVRRNLQKRLQPINDSHQAFLQKDTLFHKLRTAALFFVIVKSYVKLYSII